MMSLSNKKRFDVTLYFRYHHEVICTYAEYTFNETSWIHDCWYDSQGNFLHLRYIIAHCPFREINRVLRIFVSKCFSLTIIRSCLLQHNLQTNMLSVGKGFCIVCINYNKMSTKAV